VTTSALIRKQSSASSLLEKDKRPGVYYALTNQDVELPVIDITHPAFALNVSDAEQRAAVQKFLQEPTPFHKLPKSLRSLMLRFFLRGSVLADGISQAQGSFLSGMHTYLLKLGPDMLGTAYAKAIDRKIAAALPSWSVRLRLQDIAHLTADTLTPVLASDRTRPLRLLSIAGGPAIDILNALILLSKKPGNLLADRSVSIEVLDIDHAGADFGKRALAALSVPGGPLHGYRIDFRYVHYNWSKASDLHAIVRQPEFDQASVLCSSEGGLFEYGSDDEIMANLQALRESAGVVAVIGSVTRADETTQRLRQISISPTRPRGLAAFRSLIQTTGWNLVRSVYRPLSDQVVLS
jgi:hypothetical protein